MGKQHAVLLVDHIVCIYALLDGHSECPLALATVTRAAVTLCVQCCVDMGPCLSGAEVLHYEVILGLSF